MRPSAPPGLAVRLLHWRLPPEHREFFLGDMEERFYQIASEQGDPRAARRWYWRQALLALLQAPCDEHAGHDEKAGFPPEWATQIEISCSS